MTEADKKFMAAYDPQGANKLLDEMGLKRGSDGIRLRSDGKQLTVLWEYTLQYVWSPEFPVLIADYWRAVGVNVLLKEVNTQLTRDKQKSNTLDITNGGFKQTAQCTQVDRQQLLLWLCLSLSSRPVAL